MLQLFQVYSKVIHIHIYSFLRFFSITVYYKVFWMEFPMLSSRTLLFLSSSFFQHVDADEDYLLCESIMLGDTEKKKRYE